MLSQTLHARDFFQDCVLPIRLFFTRSSTKASWHNHEFTELAIILSGHGVYETEFSVENIAPGDVLVMPAGGGHFFRDEDNIEQINVLFQFGKLPVPCRDICHHPGFSALFRITPEYCHKQRFYPRFRLDDLTLRHVRALLMSAYEVQEARKIGFFLTVYGAFLQLIPLLLANFPATSSQGDRPAPERLMECLDFMQENFRRDMTVGALARKAGMTEVSFVRHFKSATGCTPLDFILRLRLEEAAYLLRSEGASVAEAALRSGFNDSNYFARLFRKRNGVTPTEFARQ